MRIDVYADIACPWCYIGERRIRRAVEDRPALQVDLYWRPYQLQPGMPRQGLPWSEFLESKFGGRQSAAASFQRIQSVGEEDGIEFQFDRIATAPNTLDAHRLVLLAGRAGLEWMMAEALFQAHFAGGLNISDRDTLVDIAAGVGLDPDEVRAYLDSEEDVDAVRQSQEESQELGIQGVPFYAINEKYGLSGAQPYQVFLEVLDTVAAEEGVAAGR